jgi:hypothetical protein
MTLIFTDISFLCYSVSSVEDLLFYLILSRQQLVLFV